MNHNHDRPRSFFARSRPLLIQNLTFGIRAGGGGPRLEATRLSAGGQKSSIGQDFAAFRYASLTAQTPAHETGIKRTTTERRVKLRGRLCTSISPPPPSVHDSRTIERRVKLRGHLCTSLSHRRLQLMIRAPEVFAPAVRGVWDNFAFSMTAFCVFFTSVSASFSSYSKSVVSRFRLFWLGILVRMRSFVSIAAYAVLQK